VSLSLIRKFSRHLLKALEYLSRPDVDIIHCDLKPENIVSNLTLIGSTFHL
jgi:dual specificity tyrosine-phosphorylation-regulated kinase 1